MISPSAKCVNSFLLNTAIHCIKVYFDVQYDEMIAEELYDKRWSMFRRSHGPRGNDVSLLNGKYLSAFSLNLNHSHVISIID